MFKGDPSVHRNNMTVIVKPSDIAIENSSNAETYCRQVEYMTRIRLMIQLIYLLGYFHKIFRLYIILKSQ